MKKIEIFPETVFSMGPVNVTDTVVTTWLVMALIAITSYLLTRRLSLKPSLSQEIVESLFEAVEKTIKEVLPIDPWLVVPVLGTLWIFIGFANLTGLLPGLRTPTADINTTFAFAVISFSLTHVYGIMTEGVRGYLGHYREPTLLLLPFHLMAEVTRTVALAVRLCGNMLSGDMIALILLGVVGFLVPIPFAMLHIIIGLIQAYIFGVLTLVFIAGGINPAIERRT
ncbi:MAG TPA: F0F1 ATP synthase subunit A [Geobacteraceae bacterium]|nr:F0F1 ATP synthase subunit A [Geobacteraceae bacterium]